MLSIWLPSLRHWKRPALFVSLLSFRKMSKARMLSGNWRIYAMATRRQIENRLRKLEERLPPHPNAEPTVWEMERITNDVYDPLVIRYLASQSTSSTTVETLLEQGDYEGAWKVIADGLDDDHRPGAGVS